VKFFSDKIDTLVLGRSFQFEELQHFCEQQYRCTRYRDVLGLALPEGEAWVFDYGTLVLWGVSEECKQLLLTELKERIEDPLEKAERERYRFMLDATEARIHHDVVSLTDDSVLTRLAVSHALAQSMKLSMFEDLAQSVIEENAYIPKALADTGKMPVSRRVLAQKRGVLFGTKSDILLHFNLLDTPEFFWDYPELEAVYLMAARYFDIIPRVNILSKKLETIHEFRAPLNNINISLASRAVRNQGILLKA